jgi:transcriptional regulator with XRE-family HTH domain
MPIAELPPLEGCQAVLTAWNGERLRELRERMQLSQAGLAAAANVGQNSISQWERNDRVPGVEEVFRLADALGVDCNAFRQEVGEEPIKRRRKN